MNSHCRNITNKELFHIHNQIIQIFVYFDDWFENIYHVIIELLG